MKTPSLFRSSAPFARGGFLLSALLSTLWSTLHGCGQPKQHQWLSGNYQFVSASLIQTQGQTQSTKEILCEGTFTLFIEPNKQNLSALPKGSLTCKTSNPSVFSEQLGGDCELEAVSFFDTKQESIFQAAAPKFYCEAAPSAEAKSTLTAVSADAIELKRTGIAPQAMTLMILRRVKP